MGLCKCPKKKVTNLFCYEHRVNVCESCMVKHHSKCIVQSYLQWLQDSDYNPNCVLCGQQLSSEDCIRLICLHVFHWKCFERRCKNLPITTAPAGYKCPVCDEIIFPCANVATPVADNLREQLSSVNWARIALGLPIIEEPDHEGIDDKYKPMIDMVGNSNPSDRSEKDNLVIYLDEQVYARPEETAQMPRRIMSNFTNTKFLLADEDDKKDRKDGVSSFSRWLQHIGRRLKFHTRERYGYCKMGIITIILIFVLCTVFSILGRMATENDPEFDPKHNPHVHLNKQSS